MNSVVNKILMVDDEPDFERLVRQRMRHDIRAGTYSLVFASNGVEAIDRLNEIDDIDMVLTDINMPQMDGLTLLEQISKIAPNIRSVVVSAYGDMRNIRTAMNRGAFDFVTKPIDFADLKVTIDRTLRHLKMLREALAIRDELVALQQELGVARLMQQSILPEKFPRSPYYQVMGHMLPAREVGGDFFDIINLIDKKIALTIADVSGKGVPAALFMMSTRTLLKGAAIGSSNPGVVLREVNNLLEQDNKAAMFVTVFYAVYDPATGEFTYANGGHNPPLLVHANGSVEILPLTNGIALGVMPNCEYNHRTIVMDPGDTVVLYTDGVTEAMNTSNEEFGVERLCNIFSKSSLKDPTEINDAIFQAVQSFAGLKSQSDDITCLILKKSEAEL